jgi:hypothetical protein
MVMTDQDGTYAIDEVICFELQFGDSSRGGCADLLVRGLPECGIIQWNNWNNIAPGLHFKLKYVNRRNVCWGIIERFCEVDFESCFLSNGDVKMRLCYVFDFFQVYNDK